VKKVFTVILLIIMIIAVNNNTGNGLIKPTSSSPGASTSPLVFKYLAYNILNDGTTPGYD